MSPRARVVAFGALALTALACLVGVYAYLTAPRRACAWNETELGYLIDCPGLGGGSFIPKSGFLDSEFGARRRYEKLYFRTEPRGLVISWSLEPTSAQTPLLQFGYSRAGWDDGDRVIVASIYSRTSGRLVDFEIDCAAHSARVTDRRFLDPARLREQSNGDLVFALPPR